MALKAIGAAMARVGRPTLARRGKAFAAIVAHWSQIAGASVAAGALPERLTGARPGEDEGGGALTLRVAGGVALSVQHLSPQLIERINAFVGFQAVSRLKIIQGPIPGADRPPTAKPLAPETAAEVDAEVAGIADPPLRAALAGLGRAMKRPEGDTK